MIWPSREPILLATLAVALCASCGSNSEPPAEPAGAAAPEQLQPFLRIAGSTENDSRTATPPLATINDVTRPVLSKARAQGVIRDCQFDPADPDAPCTIRPDTKSGKTRWYLLDPVEAAPKRRKARDLAEDHVAGPLPEPRVRVAGTKAGDAPVVVPAHDSLGLRALAVPPVSHRTVTTAAREIPDDAVLRFSIATEPQTWGVDSAPIDFIVTSLTGPEGQRTTTELFRASMDPARKEDERRWNDYEISLAPLGGKMAQLQFRTLPTTRGDRRPQLPLWGDPTILSPISGSPQRPFVVLISLDTLRARSLSALGRAIETSPYFDRLAQEGALFEQAFTTYSNTLGSHMSMHTGLWPRSHRVVGMGVALGRDKKTLAERMRSAGYETAAFTENALLNARAGFERGFGRYAENKEIAPGAGLSRETFAAALDWVFDHQTTPFFLFVHTYEVHAPYKPPPPFDAALSPHDRAGSALELYEQEILYLDGELNEFIGELELLVGAENLLLVITSDHGEEFGEHGQQLHTQLYDEVMHVPLLLRWPGHVPAGRRIAQPVSLVDIPPTILELAGVKRFRTQDGSSLVPLLRANSWGVREAVFGEAVTSRKRTFVARSATHKCMLEEGLQESVCFDLISDPEEKTGFAWNRNESTRTLHDALLTYRGGKPEAGQEPLTDAKDSTEIDPKREQKLRALGYVE